MPKPEKEGLKDWNYDFLIPEYDSLITTWHYKIVNLKNLRNVTVFDIWCSESKLNLLCADE